MGYSILIYVDTSVSCGALCIKYNNDNCGFSHYMFQMMCTLHVVYVIHITIHCSVIIMAAIIGGTAGGGLTVSIIITILIIVGFVASAERRKKREEGIDHMKTFSTFFVN